MAACFCNRLVLCFDGDKTINGGVGMEVIFIIGIVLIAFGVYLFLKDFTYMLQGFILMILGAGILGISLSYIV